MNTTETDALDELIRTDKRDASFYADNKQLKLIDEAENKLAQLRMKLDAAGIIVEDFQKQRDQALACNDDLAKMNDKLAKELAAAKAVIRQVKHDGDLFDHLRGFAGYIKAANYLLPEIGCRRTSRRRYESKGWRKMSALDELFQLVRQLDLKEYFNLIDTAAFELEQLKLSRDFAEERNETIAQLRFELEQLKLDSQLLKVEEKRNAEFGEYLKQLRAALEKKEALIVRLKETLVLDKNDRPRHLWDLLSGLDEARWIIKQISIFWASKECGEAAVAWLDQWPEEPK